MLHVNGFPGLYVVIEGGVGVGKTVHSRRSLDALRVSFPHRTIVNGREPGKTPIAEQLRPILKNQDLDPELKAALFHAARVETIKGFITPHMEQGHIVWMDRSFKSSLANQGEGDKVGFDKVWKINEDIVRTCWPDIVIFLYRETNQALKDSTRNIHDSDHFDTKGEDYHKRVQLGYLRSMGLFRDKSPKTQFIFADGTNKTEGEVFADIWAELHPLVSLWDLELREGKVTLETTGRVHLHERW